MTSRLRGTQSQPISLNSQVEALKGLNRTYRNLHQLITAQTGSGTQSSQAIVDAVKQNLDQHRAVDAKLKNIARQPLNKRDLEPVLRDVKSALNLNCDTDTTSIVHALYFTLREREAEQMHLFSLVQQHIHNPVEQHTILEALAHLESTKDHILLQIIEIIQPFNTTTLPLESKFLFLMIQERVPYGYGEAKINKKPLHESFVDSLNSTQNLQHLERLLPEIIDYLKRSDEYESIQILAEKLLNSREPLLDIDRALSLAEGVFLGFEQEPAAQALETLQQLLTHAKAKLGPKNETNRAQWITLLTLEVRIQMKQNAFDPEAFLDSQEENQAIFLRLAADWDELSWSEQEFVLATFSLMPKQTREDLQEQGLPVFSFTSLLEASTKNSVGFFRPMNDGFAPKDYMRWKDALTHHPEEIQFHLLYLCVKQGIPLTDEHDALFVQLAYRFQQWEVVLEKSKNELKALGLQSMRNLPALLARSKPDQSSKVIEKAIVYLSILNTSELNDAVDGKTLAEKLLKGELNQHKKNPNFRILCRHALALAYNQGADRNAMRPLLEEYSKLSPGQVDPLFAHLNFSSDRAVRHPLNTQDLKAEFTAEEHAFIKQCMQFFTLKSHSPVEEIQEGLAHLEMLVGLDPATAKRLNEYPVDVKQVLILQFCNALAYQGQASFIEKGLQNLARAEPLVAAVLAGREIDESKKLSLVELQPIIALAEVYPALEAIRKITPHHIPLPPKLRALLDLSGRAKTLCKQIEDQIPKTAYPTGTVFLQSEARKIPLMSTKPKAVYGSLLPNLWNRMNLFKGQLIHPDVKPVLDSFVKDIKKGDIFAAQPLFTGDYKHAGVAICERTKEDRIVLKSAEVLEEFSYAEVSLQEFIMSDAFHISAETLMTEELRLILRDHPEVQMNIQALYEEQVEALLHANLKQFQVKGRMKINKKGAASAAFSSQDLKRPRYDLSTLADKHPALAQLKGTYVNFPAFIPEKVIDSFFEREETTEDGLYSEHGVQLEFKELFCSEFVARLLTQASHDTNAAIRERLIEALGQDQVGNKRMLNPLFPDGCRFDAVHPNALYDQIKSHSMKIEYPAIITSLLRASDLGLEEGGDQMDVDVAPPSSLPKTVGQAVGGAVFALGAATSLGVATLAQENLGVPAAPIAMQGAAVSAAVSLSLGYAAEKTTSYLQHNFKKVDAPKKTGPIRGRSSKKESFTPYESPRQLRNANRHLYS